MLHEVPLYLAPRKKKARVTSGGGGRQPRTHTLFLVPSGIVPPMFVPDATSGRPSAEPEPRTPVPHTAPEEVSNDIEDGWDELPAPGRVITLTSPRPEAPQTILGIPTRWVATPCKKRRPNQLAEFRAHVAEFLGPVRVLWSETPEEEKARARDYIHKSAPEVSVGPFKAGQALAASPHTSRRWATATRSSPPQPSGRSRCLGPHGSPSPMTNGKKVGWPTAIAAKLKKSGIAKTHPKGGFYQVPIDDKARSIAAFQSDRGPTSFTALPMGASPSAHLFTRVTQPLVCAARALGARYTASRDTLRALGMAVNLRFKDAKTSEASQTPVFMGLVHDLRREMLFIPKDKQNACNAWILVTVEKTVIARPFHGAVAPASHSQDERGTRKEHQRVCLTKEHKDALLAAFEAVDKNPVR
ncbi:hypothetical protein J8273_0572 [Carpediemonas membranifera]|uniref:Uncharacterized protein n=1 Tax=Carpediemonas membranifera TaxID=201153 RepID=A0A8J6E306_9EUKA|nr:hypothetical protein J8273_0572 [Carpediemonas membranifera]|eukprot:KAG9395333.1 hypothetical protein J8273_0572 [Carpediemonas membranifera]